LNKKKFSLNDLKAQLMPQISQMVEEILNNYSKEQLEKDLKDLVPKLAQEILSKEMEKLAGP
jgi:FKBP-type peptidyl-prolyl cis-trans isomerase (trigger factor)